MKKKNVILSILGSVMLIGTTSSAQQIPPDNFLSDSFNHTDAVACLKLYEQLNVKREGKATAYRLMGTRSNESGQLIDSHQIWYSHEFTSNLIPPLVSSNVLSSNYGYMGTLFDSVVKFIPDQQNPGQLIPQFSYGYSFNTDMLPVAYYFKYLNTDSRRSLYTYTSAKQLLSVVDEKETDGIWKTTDREQHTFIGNLKIIEGHRYYELFAKWDTLFRIYVWYNSNLTIDSSYRENYLNGDWTPFDAVAYDYNSIGQITRVARYKKNFWDSLLTQIDMELNSYDAAGKLQSTMYYFGSNSILISRKGYHYSGSFLDFIKTESWNAGDSAWEDRTHTVFNYSSGLITKKETFYNDNGKVRPYTKLEFTSDSNQNISYSGYYEWDTVSQTYTEGVKHYYYYESYEKTNTSLIKVEKKKLHLYPNPAKGLIHIEIPFEGNGSYKVISIDGKELFVKDIAPMDERLLLVDLNVNSGVYFIMLMDGSGRSYSGKVAIE